MDGVNSQLGGLGPRPAREIRSLNSIRGVAALMVALFHAPLLLAELEARLRFAANVALSTRPRSD
jgi:peptidoglycan/LPS O-acetylase OafA/YrhL